LKAFGITCGILVLLTIIGGFLIYNVVKTQLKNPNSPVSIGIKAGLTVTQGVAIQQGIVKYKTENGNYPANLAALTPKYVPMSMMHSSFDKSTDPNHISWQYIRPTASSDPKSPMLKLPVTIDGETRTITINIDGSTVNNTQGGYDQTPKGGFGQ